ncbi:hypothetical protein GCM10028807_26160 [Spirosoma daeguense]
MKSLFLFATFISFFWPTDYPFEEPAGIRFFTGSWQEVLQEAKRQNKPIYVDFHTSWCPPCKRMSREAFPNPEVGTKFNENFISYQLDAEVGEGAALARLFAVASYPTALYFIPTGEIVHRGVGYGGVNAMLKQADLVLSMPKVRRTRRKKGVNHEVTAPVFTSPSQTDSTGKDVVRY